MKLETEIKKGATFYEDKTMEEIQEIVDIFNEEQRKKGE